MPIIHDNIEFHNAAATSDGVEMRFFSGVTWLSLTLSARSNFAWANGAVAPIKPAILITIFPNSDDAARTLGLCAEHNQAFRTILRRIHADSRDPHLHLIEGTDILPSFAGLSADLIHPSPDGHQLMGFNLAARLRGLITATASL
ncbi:MAG: hypothetical protein PCFJNLEI_02063 [Verrucomicrobiae bacterium]|nr:hypothetical protein [Verrucomicrobiae bacterium]